MGLAIAVACTLCIADFLWEGTIGFNLADEGYLWYGAQRLMHGEVPFCDYQAYYPARYYWAAMVMWMRGNNGLVSLWLSVAIFQAIGLFMALAALTRSAKRINPAWLILVAVALLVWMIPRHKIFDITISIFLITALAWLVERPDKTRFFFAGISVGLAAVFNPNHGLYGLLGNLGAIALCYSNNRQAFLPMKKISSWSAGVAAGFLPMLLLMIFTPGFSEAFWVHNRFLVERVADSKNTNLPLPVPWPWQAAFETSDWFTTLNEALLGILFVGVILFGTLGIVNVIYRRIRNLQQSPLLVASTFMALPYAHHAFSRAEVLHLAQGLFPFLLGSFAWASSRGPGARWGTAMGLLLVSLIVALPAHLGYQCVNEGNWSEVRLGRDRIKASPATVKKILGLQDLVNHYAPSGEAFLALPYWPGAYAVQERKSPVWEIYALFPRNRHFEENEIARINNARPRFAIVQDIPLEGREELKFSNTHPLIYQYITAHFKKVLSPFQDATLNVYLPLQDKP